MKASFPVSTNDLTYKMLELVNKKSPSQAPKARGDALKRLILSDHQSKTQDKTKYSVYKDIKHRKAQTPHSCC